MTIAARCTAPLIHATRVTCFLALATPALAQAPSPDPIPLAEAVMLSASQRASDTATYTFEAGQGQTYLIELDQQGLDFIVTVETPDGNSRSFNSPLRRDEFEHVLLENAAPGAHRIIVHSEEHTGAVASHSIRLSALPTATDDRERTAWRLMSEAAARYLKGGQDEWLAARDAYAGAAALWRLLGQARREAQAKYSVAMIDYWHTKNREQSRVLAEEAADLYAEINEGGLLAKAIYLQATSLIETAEEDEDPEAQYVRALSLFEQAAAIQRQLGRLYDLAFTTTDVGLLYYNRGDWRNARRYWAEAAGLFSSVDEWSGELYPVGNLAVIDAEEGHLETAIAALDHALELMPPDRNLRHRADTLANLGGAQRMFGNFDAALRAFSDALALGEQLESAYVIGWALSGIGETYYGMGEMQLASDYLQAALPKEREAGDQRGEAAVLRYLGSIEYSQGNHAGAVELHEQALRLATAPPDRALVELLLAQDLAALGRYEAAARAAETALAIASESDSVSLRADALEQLGRVQVSAGNARAAADPLETAQAIYASLALHTEQARALNGLALASGAIGDLAKAVDYGERSLSHIENVRGSLADPRLRAFYLGARREYYELQIHLLMQLHARSEVAGTVHEGVALAVSERARARMLVDILREAAVELREPDRELGQRREQLYASLGELRRQRDQLLAHPSGDGISDALTAIVGRLAAVENELNLLEAEARGRDPKWGNLSAPETLTGSELQQVLDPESVLIEYALGAEQSYVWVVTRESIHSVVLADRRTIEDAATRVYDGLRQPSLQRRAVLTEDLTRLADLVLTPIASRLSKDRLLIAADGALQYIPFAVLPLRGQDGATTPLLQAHEIVGLPSLSALASQRSAEPSHEPSKRVAIFADPIFDPTDSRLTDQYVAVVADSAPMKLVTRSSAGSSDTLARLPLSAREAEAIADLVPEGDRFVALGFEASRDTVLGMDLEDYRIIHFATHGLIDPRYPDLSALALSQFDASGAPRQGFLRLPDIYGLTLNADLVVLSACETALGREIHGEGLLGLTQGFLYAGAKSLVASLWPVADRATTELMARFYDYMLNGGLRPAEALRRAQLSIAAERRWSDPYFWGAFIVLGEWQ